MKKIVFIHHNTIPVGAGLSALHILSNLPLDEYEVVACIPAWNGDLKEKIEKLGIRVRADIHSVCSYTHIRGYHYNLLSLSHLHNVMDIAKSKDDINKVIIEEKPDIVMVNSMTLFWVGKIAQKLGIKTICFDRETYYRGLVGLRTQFIKRRMNKTFNRVVFLSNYDMIQTGKEFGKYTVITDKVDIALYDSLDKVDARNALELPQNEKLILFVGGLSYLKGIKVALNIINGLRKEAKLIVLQYVEPPKLKGGIAGFRQEIRRITGQDSIFWANRYIESNKLRNSLILRNTAYDVEKYFVACDMVIFPSQEPHQARPIFEAGAAKRPIILSDFENTREFLDDKNGWVVGHNDISAWEKCCRRVLHEHENVADRIELNYKKTCRSNDLKELGIELHRLLKGL